MSFLTLQLCIMKSDVRGSQCFKLIESELDSQLILQLICVVKVKCNEYLNKCFLWVPGWVLRSTFLWSKNGTIWTVKVSRINYWVMYFNTEQGYGEVWEMRVAKRRQGVETNFQNWDWHLQFSIIQCSWNWVHLEQNDEYYLRRVLSWINSMGTI